MKKLRTERGSTSLEKWKWTKLKVCQICLFRRPEVAFSCLPDEAEKLTVHAEGKHHISQFLPSEEFEKFMSSFQAAKEGQVLDKSDYQDAKLTDENKGI